MNVPVKFPYLLDPDGLNNGWSYVSTGPLTSLPAATLPANYAALARYLDIELDYITSGAAAEPDYFLALNGSTASRGSCIIDSSIVATAQVPRRPDTIRFGGFQTASDSIFRAKATLELTPGRQRLFTARSTSFGASYVNESSYVNGTVDNTALVISSIQVMGFAVNNLLAGSRWRLVLRNS